MKVYKTSVPEIQLKTKKGDLLKIQVTSSNDSYEYFKHIFDENYLEIREEFMVVYLNNSNNTIGYFRAGVGGINFCPVDIRLILRGALECGATSMIVAHNHPSGKLEPSKQDVDITHKLNQAGLIMDIRLLDHIIITTDGYYSFADMGKI